MGIDNPQPSEGDGAVACGKCGVRQPLQHSPDCGRPAATAVVPDAEAVLVPREEVERAVKAMRYAAHPHPSPNADALAKFLAAAPAAPKGGVDEAMVSAGADALVLGWNLHYPDAMRMSKEVLTAALNPEQQPPTEQATRSRLRRVAIEKGEPAPRFDEMGGRDWIDNRDDDDLEAWLGDRP